MKKLILMLTLFMVSLCLAHQDKTWKELKGPFFGQKHKGSGVELFMPGLISIEVMEGNLAFLNNDKVCIFSNVRDGILYTFQKNGVWTIPQKAPLDYDGHEYNFNAGPKGKNLYFTSRRPTTDGDPHTDLNIWVLPWERETWGKPYPLPFPPNTKGQDEIHPTLTINGTIYYFTPDRAGSKASKIYRRKWLKGKYGQEEELGWPVNSGWDEFDPVVASDESFMLFSSRRPGSLGKDDIYACFMSNDEQWSDPLNLGEPYNTRDYEHRINLVPGDKYFFFGSGRDNSTLQKQIPGKPGARVDGVYWVETSFLKNIKQFIQSRSSAAGVIEKVYQKKGISTAINELGDLYSKKTKSYYFLPYQLLNICERMIKAGKYNDADKFYQGLLKTFPEKFRIKRGFALINITNNKITKGFNLLKKVMAGSPRYFKSDLYLRARDFIWDSKFHNAIKLLKLCIKEFPNWAYAYYLLAQSYEKTGDFNKAVNYFKNTLKLEPDFPEAEEVSEKLKELEKKRKNRPGSNFPGLTGPYLGQKPPGMAPEIFAPGIISTGLSESCPAFTPDGKEFYFKIGGAPHGVILFMRQNDKRWLKPEVVSFSGKYNEEFSMSPDGGKIVFSSNRPLNGRGEPREHYFCWIVERSNTGWSEPINMGPLINSGIFAGYPTLSKAGNLYFYAEREGGMGVDDIYFSKVENGKFTKPVNLGNTINSEFVDGDPFIDPEENYLVLCSVGRPDGYGGADLYISFRKKDASWTKAKNMGEKINSTAWEICPGISPDGRYLFFSSNRKTHNSYSREPITYEEKIKILNSPGNGNADIYWVDIRFIEQFRPKSSK